MIFRCCCFSKSAKLEGFEQEEEEEVSEGWV